MIRNWVVRDITNYQIAVDFVRKYHYARGCSITTTFKHGLYCSEFGLLMGVALWLPPTRAVAEYVCPYYPVGVLSLSRLCIRPGQPKNCCSFLLARSRKIIRKDGRFEFLVTYADEGEGHKGRIYLGDNWRYDGDTKPSFKWVDKNGVMVSVKSTRKTRSQADMLALGYTKQGPYVKHRYIRTP